jgi:hypothetical protein
MNAFMAALPSSFLSTCINDLRFTGSLYMAIYGWESSVSPCDDPEQQKYAVTCSESSRVKHWSVRDSSQRGLRRGSAAVGLLGGAGSNPAGDLDVFLL